MTISTPSGREIVSSYTVQTTEYLWNGFDYTIGVFIPSEVPNVRCTAERKQHVFFPCIDEAEVN